MTILVAPCTYRAASYACRHWHYSRKAIQGSFLRLGVWECGKFIGVLLFGRGANNHIGSPYSLAQNEICELQRVALNAHIAPVTKIISWAIRLLKKQYPNLRLIVSYADKGQGHIGKIYQAGNWIYEGQSAKSLHYKIKGKLLHKKSASSRYGCLEIDVLKSNIDPNAEQVYVPGKFKYLYPLDKGMRRQILKLAKPYPKDFASA